LYAWQRHGPEYVWCESQFEKDRLMWLDWEGEVRRLWAQPFAIVFPPSKDGLSWHVPDFLGQFNDGTLHLYDVKPERQRDQTAEAQFIRTAEICHELGWPYHLLDASTQSDRATANLKWFKAVRHGRCAPSASVLDLILAHAVDGAPRDVLCEVADPDCPTRAAVWVDYLVWHRRLVFDIAELYGSRTVLTAAPVVTR
jgi:hypothetical protein